MCNFFEVFARDADFPYSIVVASHAHIQTPSAHNHIEEANEGKKVKGDSSSANGPYSPNSPNSGGEPRGQTAECNTADLWIDDPFKPDHNLLDDMVRREREREREREFLLFLIKQFCQLDLGV